MCSAFQSNLNNWAAAGLRSSGPEALIKQALLANTSMLRFASFVRSFQMQSAVEVGNLTAAVELCFKSGKMAEAVEATLVK